PAPGDHLADPAAPPGRLVSLLRRGKQARRDRLLRLPLGGGGALEVAQLVVSVEPAAVATGMIARGGRLAGERRGVDEGRLDPGLGVLEEGRHFNSMMADDVVCLWPRRCQVRGRRWSTGCATCLMRLGGGLLSTLPACLAGISGAPLDGLALCVDIFLCEGKRGAPDLKVPDRLGRWPIRKPSPWGSRNGPRSGPGSSGNRVFIENSSLASVRECPLSAKRDPRGGHPNRVVRPPGLDGVVRIIERKVASWKALVELYKSLWIVEFRSTRGKRKRHNATNPRKARGDSDETQQTGRRVVSKDTRRTAATSKDRRSSPGGARGRRKTRGVLRRRRERAWDESDDPADDKRGGGASSGRPVVLSPCAVRPASSPAAPVSHVPRRSSSVPPGDGAARPPGSLCGVLRRRQERAYDITPAAAPSGSSLQAVHRPPPTAGRDHDVRPFAFRALDIKFYQKRTKSRLLQGIPHSRAHRQSRRRPEDRRSSRGARAGDECEGRTTLAAHVARPEAESTTNQQAATSGTISMKAEIKETIDPDLRQYCEFDNIMRLNGVSGALYSPVLANTN
ncbi:hypothetical protein THAOC_34657, partial [Thalassiosira oceanica]